MAQNIPAISDSNADPWDPEALQQCPYDKSHQIRAIRFPYHLIKCGKNHPELAKQLKSCPFNARHLVQKHELSSHIANCEDRVVVTHDDSDTPSMNSRWQPISVSNWQAPPCEEDWDQEADLNPVKPFFWGETNSLNKGLQTSSSEVTVAPGIRAPRVLPWKN
ncbi:gametocyte-specific factor 1-like [Polypterus senegalus]|uniref:gametocyte-specific factor 1-like n=1 Tax=Polypterus senegalus TaxID=55291 RepID=UPI001963F1AD|nr:gametocyte-specific factor 1-like [Polypterus senegalus]